LSSTIIQRDRVAAGFVSKRLFVFMAPIYPGTP
jgi:hypothetical protein